PENRPIFAVMFFQVDGRFVNHFQTVDIAFVSSITPGKQAMSAQHDTSDSRIGIQSLLKFQSQFKTGPSPRHPSDLSFKKIFGDLLPIFGSSNGNRRIRMKMVYMFKRKKSV